jgi:hypothetical protein
VRPVSASRVPFNAEQDDVCTMSARDWRNFIFQLPLLVQADGLLIKDPVYEKVCVCVCSIRVGVAQVDTMCTLLGPCCID